MLSLAHIVLHEHSISSLDFIGVISIHQKKTQFVNNKCWKANCTKSMYTHIIFVRKYIHLLLDISSLVWFPMRRNHAWPDPALFQMQSEHKQSTEYSITPFTDSKCLCKKPQTAQVFSLVATKHLCSLATEWQGQNSPLSGVYSNYLPHYCKERQSAQEMR